jgi:hypothetical protein
VVLIKKANPNTDQRLRSLLQKAVRRGYVSLVNDVARILYEKGQSSWLRSRAVVITFEECWPLGLQLDLSPAVSTKIGALCKVATTIKNKDAAGLGTLAHALSEGDKTVFSDDEDDLHIKIVSEAIQRPSDFFAWLNSRCETTLHSQLVQVARRYLSSATWPWDKAFILAGSYLGVIKGIPSAEHIKPTIGDFPYWVALDKHTPQGKDALRRVAKEIGCQYRQLIWTSFYLESAQANAQSPSIWWDREIQWRFGKAKLTVAEARHLWDAAKPRLTSMLSDESAKLAQDVLRHASVQPAYV